MCEPFSCAIGTGAVCLFCCVIIAVIGWKVFSVLGPIMAVVSDALQCANATIADEVNNLTSPGGDCEQMDQAGCNVSQTPNDKNDTCTRMQGKCACEVVKQLEERKIGQLVMPCCDRFQSLEQSQMFKDMAETAVTTCQDLLVNATAHIKEVNENCSKGILPTEGASAFVPMGSGGGLQDALAQKFEAVGASLPPHHVLPRVGAAAFGSGALAVGFVVAASVALRLRRTRGGSHKPAGGADGVLLLGDSDDSDADL